MTLDEELARNKVNEAIKTGLESQKIHRMLTENRDSKKHVRKTQTISFHVNLIKKLVQLTVSFLNLV
jgi:hypothetical protein